MAKQTLSKAWGRRRLFALVGLGVGAVQAGLGSERQAEATGPVVGINNYAGSPDAMADGVQGYAVGANNAGTFGRNNDLNGVGVFGAAPNGTGVFGESATGFGVGGKSSSKYGVYGQASNGVGGAFEGGLAAIRLMPAASGTGAPTTGAHQVGELYADSTGALYYCTVTGTPGTWLPVALGSGGGSLTTVESTLASNVNMPSSNTYYDGPSVSLSPGTWLLVGSVTLLANGTNTFSAKLWNGTTVESSGYGFNDSTITLVGLVTVASTTTWKISASSQNGGKTIMATTPGAGASRLVGIKVG